MSGTMMSERELTDHLMSVVSAIGGMETRLAPDGGEVTAYRLGDQCLECLKDIKRFLRQDDTNPQKQVIRLLGQWQILQKDLLHVCRVVCEDGPLYIAPTRPTHPALMPSDEGDEQDAQKAKEASQRDAEKKQERQKAAARRKIIQAVMEVLVPLTWPANFEQQPTLFAELQSYLLSYKEAFAQEETLRIVLDFLLVPLSKSEKFREDRDIDDIRLGLTLLRNLVCIKDPPRHTRVTSGELENLSTLQEQLIVKAKQNHLLDLLVSLTSSMDEKHNAEWNVLTLEILFHLLFGRQVKSIAEAGRKMGALSQSYEREKRLKAAQPAVLSTRQSKYAGVYNYVYADGSNATIVSHDNTRTSLIDIIEKKKKVKGRIGQKANEFDMTLQHISPEAAHALRDFVDAFLESSYNSMMFSIKRDIDAEKAKIRAEDQERYLWLSAFMLDYQGTLWSNWREDKRETQRFGGQIQSVDLDFDLVACNLCIPFVRYVLRKSREFGEVRPVQYGGMTVAISAFKEILKSIDLMQQSHAVEYRDLAESLQDNLFYEFEQLEHLQRLVKQSKYYNIQYVEHLIETTHLLLRSMERYSKKREKITVRKAKRGGKKKNEDGMTDPEEDADLDEVSKARKEIAKEKEWTETQIAFPSFEMGYADEQVIAFYCIALTKRQSMKSETLHYITKMFYRLFVKMKAEADAVTPTIKEFASLVKHIIGRLMKNLEAYSLLPLEMCFPRGKMDWQRVQSCEDTRRAKAVAAEARQLAKERRQKAKEAMLTNVAANEVIEVKSSLPYEKKIGVLVTWLISTASQRRKHPASQEGEEEHAEEDDHAQARFGRQCVEWLQRIIRRTLSERRMQREEAALDFKEKMAERLRREDAGEDLTNEPLPEQDAVFAAVPLSPDSDEQEGALNTNGHLKALLSLLHFAREEETVEETDEEEEVEDSGEEKQEGEKGPRQKVRRLRVVSTSWAIPATMAQSDLQVALETMEAYLEYPYLDEDGRPLSSLITKKKRQWKKVRAKKSSSKKVRKEKKEKEPKQKKKTKTPRAQEGGQVKEGDDALLASSEDDEARRVFTSEEEEDGSLSSSSSAASSRRERSASPVQAPIPKEMLPIKEMERSIKRKESDEVERAIKRKESDEVEGPLKKQKKSSLFASKKTPFARLKQLAKGRSVDETPDPDHQDTENTPSHNHQMEEGEERRDEEEEDASHALKETEQQRVPRRAMTAIMMEEEDE